MHNCLQTEGMTIFEHGMKVCDYFTELHNHIVHNDDLTSDWNLPDYLISFYKNAKIECLETMQTYALYHDCGKSICLTIDENGRRHFPNHAQASYDLWMKTTQDETIGWYILHDMDLHMLKGECLDEVLKDPRCLNLMLMAYSEIHANASMFGGTDSTSFKIKKKKLDKAFNRLRLINKLS